MTTRFTLSPSPLAIAWLATAILYAAHALLFRFAELIAHLGGTTFDAGRIVAVGTVCSLVSRRWLGSAIDRRGARMPWLVSAVLLVVGATCFATASSLSYLLYAGRIAWAIGFAGGLACSVASIQRRDAGRVERLGILETSVFAGLIAGTAAGHAIFALGDARYWVLCAAVIALAAAYLAVTWRFARRSDGVLPRPRVRRRIATRVVLAALLIGTNFAITTIFLTRYFTQLGAARGMATFFLAYCATSFPLRLAIRRWLGRVPMHHQVCAGLAAFGVGQLALLGDATTSLLFAAFACAAGRALAYPTVLALGAGAFPIEERGQGSAAVLAAIDTGLVVAALALGAAIDRIGYAATFATSALACFAGAAVQLVKGRHDSSLSLLRS